MKIDTSNWDMKLIAIVAGCVIAFGGLTFISAQASRNSAISLEENVYTAKSDIKVAEKRRVDLLYNMVDAVKAYDAHEYNTLKDTVAQRVQKGQIDQAQLAIAAVAEAYPNLKSSALYQDLMNEFALTENQIADYRNSYNTQAQNYTRYVRSWPANWFLGWTGYEIINAPRLNYNVSEDAPTNLFK